MELTTKELKDKIMSILDDKKASDIKEIDISQKSSIADYFIICTGRSTVQVKALAESVEEMLEDIDIFVNRKEGLSDGRWAVLDYSSVIVHVFNAETRDFYCLEKLWEK